MFVGSNTLEQALPPNYYYVIYIHMYIVRICSTCSVDEQGLPLVDEKTDTVLLTSKTHSINVSDGQAT